MPGRGGGGGGVLHDNDDTYMTPLGRFDFSRARPKKFQLVVLRNQTRQRKRNKSNMKSATSMQRKLGEPGLWDWGSLGVVQWGTSICHTSFGGEAFWISGSVWGTESDIQSFFIHCTFGCQCIWIDRHLSFNRRLRQPRKVKTQRVQQAGSTRWNTKRPTHYRK